MSSDSLSVFIWWFTIFLIGLSFYPLTKIIFARFIDKGYIFAKVLGIFFLSYVAWLAGMFHILPFTQLNLILILLALLALNIFIYYKKEKIPKIDLRSPAFFFFLLEEFLFLVTLAFWSYVRAHEPSIRGLEKFMDFGFVESILHAKFFPPLDMWLTKSPDYTGGFFINYYYFGHLVTAVLTKLSGIASIVTYNLAIAVLFAFTFTLSFSLGINLIFFLLKSTYYKLQATNYKLILIGGFLAAFLVALAGNLHTIYSFTTGYPNDNPVPFWQLPVGFNPQTYWYPNATRFIPFTIHEFPIYSFVVADLHGHVSDIPFVLLTLALLLNLLLRTSVSLPYLALLGLITAVMYMTNAVDGLIYLILTGLTILYLNWHKTKNLAKTIVGSGSASLFLLFFFLVGNLPFSLNFKPFGTGIGVLCAPSPLLGLKIGPFLFEEGKCQKSALYQLSLLWGFFYFNFISFLLLVLIPRIKQKIANSHFQLTTPDIFVILTTIVSTLLLIFPEFIYIKDIYPAHYRANTMFKLGYQAFMMLGLNSAYIFFRIKLLSKSIKNMVYFVIFSFLFFLVAIYPNFAINSYYGELKTYYGLDGLQWMKREYLDDYKAVVWLRKNIVSQPVILEANGDSYTDYARVSANTGLPTVIGWPVHEWLWRGSYDEAGKRIPEVQTLYESEDLGETQRLLQKYNISYVFLGTLEHQKYTNLDETKWENLGKKVFESGNTKIYKVSLF
ncbi:hypothetical protein A2773_00500 [Candidatus Gottesmanbacteria bacterium RIFCSPHIGHO2_01_FULL_39_10]|uniref:YYY membrane protein n=1 Tax=Candidatus Gottesmanbacteria bacterium RIFCSPHIGHO2_01_FULL_39_10 TaxID=1798375 RepID=A0A1F5ZLW8_9BACT|nr:MAG: hypothetical protein A2773_00500 [Candidatus Gottesmanbacteria bacterium RIFCSPHIGHO2_01_FULL_39_10]